MSYYIQDSEHTCNIHVLEIKDNDRMSINFNLIGLSDTSCAFENKEEAEKILLKIKAHYTEWMHFINGLQVIEIQE